MSSIFAIVNQKGGVGKTTTSVNLAASLASYGKKVLMIDMDPQGNATMGCGIDKNNLEQTVLDVIVDEKPVEKTIKRCTTSPFHVLPANGDLVAAEVELIQAISRETRLRSALEKIRHNYDYILIDCPPALSMLTINALVASDGVLIPMQCEYYALEGLSALMNTVKQIKKYLNPELQIEGILRTMYDPRSSLTNEVTVQLRKHFGDKVYRMAIPRNVRLAEAPSYGQPAMVYDKHSKGSLAYLGLAAEIIRRAKIDVKQTA